MVEDRLGVQIPTTPRDHAQGESLSRTIEALMNDYVNKLGLIGWTVIWVPDHAQKARGKVLPETKTILIHDEDPENAMETLGHEILEIKLLPMLRPYRQLVNCLIEYINLQVYSQKEKIINDLVPFLIKFNEEEHSIQKKLEEARTD